MFEILYKYFIYNATFILLMLGLNSFSTLNSKMIVIV